MLAYIVEIAHTNYIIHTKYKTIGMNYSVFFYSLVKENVFFEGNKIYLKSNKNLFKSFISIIKPSLV
jgi:hypothetical protein